MKAGEKRKFLYFPSIGIVKVGVYNMVRVFPGDGDEYWNDLTDLERTLRLFPESKIFLDGARLIIVPNKNK